jgi:CubicO group peptidase (beta-lactamase class C family)
MEALRQTATWPVDHVAAAVVAPDGTAHAIGDTTRVYRVASISKMIVGWTAMVAVEEGIVDLDQRHGQEGCTLRHLLAHAGGYAFDGAEPIARPGTRRIYSNTGIELAAECIADAAGMPYEQYQREAVLEPLGMAHSTLKTSPAYGVHSTVDDLVIFLRELRSPRLISPESGLAFRTVHFPQLAGIVPGIGRFDECPWGLGTEVRDHKSPHWTGTTNSPATFGHFGGAGTLLWVDPGVEVAVVALTDRPFDEWSADALTLWPRLSDAVLQEIGG